MIAAALAGVAIVAPGMPLQLDCQPVVLHASRYDHALTVRHVPGWQAIGAAGRLVAWYVPDSELIRATLPVRGRLPGLLRVPGTYPPSTARMV